MKTMRNKILGLIGMILIITVSVLAYVKPGQTKMITLAATETKASAQTTDTATANNDAANAENEIRRILEKYYEIARTGDRAALKNFSREISAPDYLYSSELGVMDKQAAMRHFDQIDMRFVSPQFENLTIQVHGADAAIAKYRDVSTVKMNGILSTRPTQFTNVWVEQDGTWKIAAEHSSYAAPRELLPRNRFADNLAQK